VTRGAQGALLALAAALCAFCPSASADPAPSGTATAQPNTPAQPSHIVIDAKGSAGGVGASVPSGVTIAVYRAFKLDLDAVAERCTDAQASSFTCPPDSQVASGSVSGTASSAGFQQPFSGTIEAFLGPTRGGDLADVFVEVDVAGKHGGRGQLVAVSDPTFGYELRFDPLPQASLPPGFSATVNELSVNIGAMRTTASPTTPSPGTAPTGMRRMRQRCRRARRCRHRRRGQGAGRSAATVAHSLITNPPACAGSWPLQIRVRYPDHTDVRDAAIACNP
jgi:hypothetical protein